MRYTKIGITLLLFGLITVSQVHSQSFVYVGQSVSPTIPTVSSIPSSQISSTASLSIRKSSTPRNRDAFYMLVSSALGNINPSHRRLYLAGDSSSYSIGVRLFPSGNSVTEIGVDNTLGTTALTGKFNQNQFSTVSFDVIIPAITTSIPDGTYTNTFHFTAYTKPGANTLLPPEGTAITSIAFGSLAITVNATIAADAISITLDPPAATFTQGLVAGETSTANSKIRISSTGTYSLSVTSQFFGNLKTSPEGTEAIPYVFKFAGTPKDLTTGSAILLEDQPPETEQERDLEFIAINIPFVEAGYYFDNLIFILIKD